ncbi:hypothetical protein ACFL2R_01055 [Patescibacteria group bacterium]
MEKGLLQEATQHIPDPDIIVNLFDLSVVWLSPKAQEMSGYSNKHLEAEIIRVIDIFGFSEEYAKDIVWKDAQEKGTREFIAKTKSGKKYKITLNFFAFHFGDIDYRVGKIIEKKEL